MEIQAMYLKAFDPKISVKVTDLDTGKVPKDFLRQIEKTLSLTHRTFLDQENGVVYIGK